LGGGDWAVHTASRRDRARMKSLMSVQTGTEGLKYQVKLCGLSMVDLGVVLLYLSNAFVSNECVALEQHETRVFRRWGRRKGAVSASSTLDN
jgi:hypothetical protein